MPMTPEAAKAYKPRRKPEASDEPMNPQTRAQIEEMQQEIEDEKGRRKIKSMGFAKGGVTRGDGCVKKGHTKGRMV